MLSSETMKIRTPGSQFHADARVRMIVSTPASLRLRSKKKATTIA
jgi:hypothetical protein